MSSIASYLEGNIVALSLNEYNIIRSVRTCPVLDHFYKFNLNTYWKVIVGNNRLDLDSFIFLLYLCGEIKYSYNDVDPKFKLDLDAYTKFIKVTEDNWSDVIYHYGSSYHLCREALKYTTCKFMDIEYEVDERILVRLHHEGFVSDQDIINTGHSSLIVKCGITSHKFIANNKQEMLDLIVDSGVDPSNIIPNWFGEYNCLHPNYKLKPYERVPYDGVLIYYDKDDVYTPEQLNSCKEVIPYPKVK